MKFRLVDDWKCAWKWISVNCMVLAVSIQGTWACLPDDMRGSVPPRIVTFITLGVLVLGVIGRLFKQGKDDDTNRS